MPISAGAQKAFYIQNLSRSWRGKGTSNYPCFDAYIILMRGIRADYLFLQYFNLPSCFFRSFSDKFDGTFEEVVFRSHSVIVDYAARFCKENSRVKELMGTVRKVHDHVIGSACKPFCFFPGIAFDCFDVFCGVKDYIFPEVADSIRIFVDCNNFCRLFALCKAGCCRGRRRQTYRQRYRLP